MFIPVNGGQGISRPFVVGLILLLVFLGMQSDFAPSRPADTPAPEESTVSGKDSTKEQIILELSKSNEKLEKELHQLQQHILLLKHAAHQHGVEHSSRLGTMLYDDGFVIPTDSNATTSRSASADHVPADSSSLHNTSAAEESTSQATSNAHVRHEIPQHAHRTHQQTQQAVSSP